MKYLLSVLFVITVIFSSCKSSARHTVYTESQMDSLIISQNFEFQPNVAMPMGYRNINLPYGYYLLISKKSIEAYLPYFGRAYTSPMNYESGIKFTSTNFEYAVEERKSGLYEITIRCKDTSQGTIFYLSAGNNGYASLRVQENGRQGISFNGKIDTPRK